MKVSTKLMIALLAVILVAAAASAAILYLNRPSGPQVLVTVNGKEYGTYNLNTNQTVTITPADKSWHNTLVIKNGSASITESDCSNQICVYTPPLREDLIGIIVCLPHGVAVELVEAQ